MSAPLEQQPPVHQNVVPPDKVMEGETVVEMVGREVALEVVAMVVQMA